MILHLGGVVELSTIRIILSRVARTTDPLSAGIPRDA
jgi:hypothetical protein